MTSRYKHLLLATTVVAVLGTSATAWAMNRHGGDCKGMQEGPRAERMQERMQTRQAEHHARLKAALQLTPAQESAWQQYLQSRPSPATAAKDRGQWQALSAPERMEQQLAARKARDSQMTAHLDALKSFYATLSPEQQRTFDAQHQQGRGGMHGMRKQHG